MSASVNKVLLLGNVCKDPEIRRTVNGTPVVNFSLATNESWTDKSTGERKERAEFHRVVIFNEGLAKVAEQYVRKGSKIYIEGQLQTRKWTDQSGNERYSTEIVLQNFRGQLVLLNKVDGAGEARTAQPYGSDRGDFQRNDAPASFERDELDQEIPF